MGRTDYPDARRLLITADVGRLQRLPRPSLESRARRLALETGLKVTVCHYPPGTSKWNKIEHRLFSHITMNWRGRPLTSHEVIVATIAATTTRTGLTVHADWTPTPTPPARRSATRRWPPCPWTATTGTGNGTTPCAPSPSPAAARGRRPRRGRADLGAPRPDRPRARDGTS